MHKRSQCLRGAHRVSISAVAGFVGEKAPIPPTGRRCRCFSRPSTRATSIQVRPRIYRSDSMIFIWSSCTPAMKLRTSTAWSSTFACKAAHAALHISDLCRQVATLSLTPGAWGIPVRACVPGPTGPLEVLQDVPAFHQLPPHFQVLFQILPCHAVSSVIKIKIAAGP